MRHRISEPGADAPLTYSISGFAAAIGIGRSTAYALVRDGKVPTIRIGPVKRIKRETVEKIATEGLP